jgi:hypothetical protein
MESSYSALEPVQPAEPHATQHERRRTHLEVQPRARRSPSPPTARAGPQHYFRRTPGGFGGCAISASAAQCRIPVLHFEDAVAARGRRRYGSVRLSALSPVRFAGTAAIRVASCVDRCAPCEHSSAKDCHVRDRGQCATSMSLRCASRTTRRRRCRERCHAHDDGAQHPPPVRLHRRPPSSPALAARRYKSKPVAAQARSTSSAG